MSAVGRTLAGFSEQNKSSELGHVDGPARHGAQAAPARVRGAVESRPTSSKGLSSGPYADFTGSGTCPYLDGMVVRVDVEKKRMVCVQDMKPARSHGLELQVGNRV